MVCLGKHTEELGRIQVVRQVDHRIQDANRNVSFGFRADTVTEKDNWVNAIGTHLEASCGASMKLFRLCRDFSYWKVSFF